MRSTTNMISETPITVPSANIARRSRYFCTSGVTPSWIWAIQTVSQRMTS